MMRASGPAPAYSPHSNEKSADDNRGLHSDRWRLSAPRWAAAIALATLLTATTVHALTPPRKFVPTPEFDAQIEALVRAIMLMPCDHREPGYPDMRLADLRDAAPKVAD